MSNQKVKNKEIERKFLVDETKWKSTDKFTNIIQYYLSDKPTVRIRITDEKAFITIKGPNNNISHPEYEYEIPMNDAKEMIDLSIYNTITKKRYDIEYAGFNWSVDIFSKKNKGLILAEIELEHEDQEFSLPEWILKEVSNDKKYYNTYLALHPFSEWK